MHLKTGIYTCEEVLEIIKEFLNNYGDGNRIEMRYSLGIFTGCPRKTVQWYIRTDFFL